MNGRRLILYPGQRLDIPHIKAIESSFTGDLDSILQGIIGGISQSYLLSGFDIVIPTSSIQADQLKIKVANSVVLHATASEPGTLLKVSSDRPDEVLNSENPRVLGSFQNGVDNYIFLDFKRVVNPDSSDVIASWVPTNEVEIQRAVPTASNLDYVFVISPSPNSNLMLLYTIRVDANGFVTFITKSASGLFRLGRGGINPNPYYSFNFKNLVNPQTNNVREWLSVHPMAPTVSSVTIGDPQNALQFGDWSIKTLKEWMDAVMTRLKEISGSQFWYIDTSLGDAGSFSLPNVWWDSGAGHVITGAGNLTYNLVLNHNTLSYGFWQHKNLDETLSLGDSYVVGVTSLAKSLLTQHLKNKILINSPTEIAFAYNEILQNRRRFRPSLTLWRLDDDVDLLTERYARLSRNATTISSPWITATSWNYNHRVIEITTSVPHNFKAGDIIELQNFTSTTNPPNGIHFVKSVPANDKIIITTTLVPTGTPALVATNHIRLSDPVTHPYVPKFPVLHWSVVGPNLIVELFDHNFSNPISITGDISAGSPNITNVSGASTSWIGLGIEGTGIPDGAYVIDVSGTTVIISHNATTTATNVSLILNQMVHLVGLKSTNAADEPILNQRYVINGVLIDKKLSLKLNGSVTGTHTASNTAFLFYDHTNFLLTIENATPDIYNSVDVTATAYSPTELIYSIGSSSLPNQPVASGNIVFDGVVATSTVADPVKIKMIQNVSSDIEVETHTPHGLSSGSGQNIIIYGDPALSVFIRDYISVTVTVISANKFKISAADLPTAPAYNNSAGLDNTFLNSPNNPYAGPISWDSDIVIKGIVGDKLFKIPKTATAAGTALANIFNVNGVTGTAFLKDKEVAYILIERNELVSNGVNFNCSGGNIITGPTTPLDKFNNPLQPGDFVKFEIDPENRWYEIQNIVGPTIFLKSDYTGHAVSVAQRPPASGALRYCKGTYPVVFVKPHDQVDLTPNIFWLAVRRDNSGAPQIYFRGLELRAGETTNIGNQITNNLLLYTGANFESNTAPIYTAADTSGDWKFVENLTVQQVDTYTRSITFELAPPLGFQKNDRIQYSGPPPHNFVINSVLTERTVLVNENVSVLPAPPFIVKFFRNNSIIQDSDNLTLALRKEDRQLAKIKTDLARPVYDESVFIQQINLTSSTNTVKSGTFIYKGTFPTNITALAWVLHGTDPHTEIIEGANVVMPGGYFGPDSILVHIYFGSFNSGDQIYQDGASVPGRQINNAPPFPAPSIPGDLNTGPEIVLPPNRRTQIVSGSNYLVWPHHSVYKAASLPHLAGEDLLVIANDSVRESNLDYAETFGGPKAKIRIGRDLPPNTRMRFRVLSSIGSLVASANTSSVNLQTAYNAGNSINTNIGAPVSITAGDFSGGGSAVSLVGNLTINGMVGPNAVNGIVGPADQQFVIGKEFNKPYEIWGAHLRIKTHSNWSNSAMQLKTATQITTNATPTAIFDSDIAIPPNHAAKIMISVVGREASNLGAAAYRIEGLFVRGTGSVYAVGFPDSLIIGQDGSGDVTTLIFGVLSPNIVRGIIVGHPTQVWYWSAAIEYQLIANDL